MGAGERGIKLQVEEKREEIVRKSSTPSLTMFRKIFQGHVGVFLGIPMSTRHTALVCILR